jgi:cytochrome c-type biogenesis protein CcmH/NrfG
MRYLTFNHLSATFFALTFFVLWSGCVGEKKENKQYSVIKKENKENTKKDTASNKTVTTPVDTSLHETHHINNKDLAQALKIANEGIDLASKGQYAMAMAKWEDFENKCKALEKDEKAAKELESEKTTRAKILCNYGSAAVKINQNLDKAIKYLEKSTKIDPEYSIAYMLLGDIYSQLGDKTEAQKNYKKFVGMPKISEAEKDLAERKLSGSINNFVVETNDAESDQSIKEKKERLEKYHKDAQTFIKNNEPKKILIALNMYEETCIEYEKSGYLQQKILNGIAKQRAENLLHFINFSLKSGKTLNELSKTIEKTTEIDPQNGEAWIKLGDLRAAQFDKGSALEAYTKAEKCKLTPEQKKYIEDKRKTL